MHPFIRAAALTLTLLPAATLSAELAAQGDGRSAAPANLPCSLVTEKEVEAATGMDYTPGDPIEPEYENIEGGATCMWGGPGGFMGEDRPEINITFIAASARGSYTERRRTQRLGPGCTREPVRGVGDAAFAQICEGRLYGVNVFARTGKSDVLVSAYAMHGLSKAAVKPAAIALARTAAARAKDM
ncbi:MAG TPA: hypothetical protein VFM14_13365 [Gemmatimonadales bacterium]|nr:hypothetical protein [Gemmatimonadales bacterium]